MTASLKVLTSKTETKEDVINLRRQIRELQCAVADEEDEINHLLTEVERLCFDNDEKQVSHCISCQEDIHIVHSLALNTTL